MVGKKVLGWRKGVSNDGLERILNGLRKFPIDFFLFFAYFHFFTTTLRGRMYTSFIEIGFCIVFQ